MFVLIALTSYDSFGQSGIKGVKVGLNFATVDGATNYIDNRSITTFDAGVFATFDVFALIALQPELLYTMKGYKLTYNVPQDIGILARSDHLVVTGNNSYLEIPVLLKLNIPSSSLGIIKPNVFAGPEIAFALISKVKIEDTDPVYLQGNDDLTNTKTSDYGIIFGAGADINLPTITFMFDVRYDIGMKTLNLPQGPSHIKNRIITLNAGIGI
jgi:hypothetical protein